MSPILLMTNASKPSSSNKEGVKNALPKGSIYHPYFGTTPNVFITQFIPSHIYKTDPHKSARLSSC